jgi:ribosomal protein S18 acetylase RimI-like enzyme
MKRTPAEPLDHPDPEVLGQIFCDRRDLPYAWCEPVDPERLVAHANAAASVLWRAPETRAFVARDQGSGIAVYQPRAWDTRVLGLPVGSLPLMEIGAPARNDALHAGRLADALGRAALEAARADGADYVTVRLDASAVGVIQALESLGFRVVDGILHLGMGLEQIPPEPDGDVRIRDAGPGDVPRLRELASGAFAWDRFHRDPVIPNAAADAVHADWVANGVAGGIGCGVLVAETAGGIAGFFVLAEDTLAPTTLGFGVGSLSLIGVDPEQRRAGIGAALSRASLARLRQRGNRFADVATQISNVPAFNLYRAVGFRLVASQVTLRWWSGAAPVEPS